MPCQPKLAAPDQASGLFDGFAWIEKKVRAK